MFTVTGRGQPERLRGSDHAVRWGRLAHRMARVTDWQIVLVPLPKRCNAYAFTVWLWRCNGLEPLYWGA